MKCAVSCRSRHQSCDSEQIISGADQIGVHLHPLATAVARFAQTADGFHPAEGFLDAFAYPLADGVTRIMSGAYVQCGASRPPIILRHVRRDVERTAGRDEVAGVITLVATQGDPATAHQPFVGHCDCRPPFGQAVCRLHLKVNQRGVAVLHQRVGRIAQIGLLAFALAGQQCLGGR
jgi:hypothetical protein